MTLIKRSAQLVPFAFVKQGAVNNCPSGFEADSICWYIGAVNQNCNTVCSGQTKVYDTKTLSFAGSGGTNADCTTVLDGLGVAAGAVSTAANNRGCHYVSGTGRLRGTTATTATGSSATAQRACACAPQDPTPDVINFADFNETSSIQTITGINMTITIQISATDSTGTPNLMYRKNSGTWTSFTTGSPGSTTFVSGDTLQLAVWGTATHAANFTITNVTDSSTVLDTAVGTVNTVCTGGLNYLGTCYYLGAATETCFSRCSALGGCYQQQTLAVAAPAATCSTILTAFGVTPGSAQGGATEYSCAGNGTAHRYLVGSVIKCGTAAPAGYQRVCACGTGGTTVAGEAQYDGYNYRLGASGASCDTACTGHGTCVQAGLDNAFSSTAKCQEILSVLENGTIGTGSGPGATGCSMEAGPTAHMGASTTCAGTTAGRSRVCACSNP